MPYELCQTNCHEFGWKHHIFTLSSVTNRSVDVKPGLKVCEGWALIHLALDFSQSDHLDHPSRFWSLIKQSDELSCSQCSPIQHTYRSKSVLNLSWDIGCSVVSCETSTRLPRGKVLGMVWWAACGAFDWDEFNEDVNKVWSCKAGVSWGSGACKVHRSGKQKVFRWSKCLRFVSGFFFLSVQAERKSDDFDHLRCWKGADLRAELPNAWTMIFRWIRWKEIGGTHGFGVFHVLVWAQTWLLRRKMF